MSDRILLHDMTFEARHGVHDWERVTAQRFEVDLELGLDLRPAGAADDLELTVDYGPVYNLVREIVETRSYFLLEALADAIAGEILARFPVVEDVLVRIRKPQVRLAGPLRYAGVEIRRSRAASGENST